MRIHFYDQWDKPSTEKARQGTFTKGNRINLVFIVVGIVTAFVFSYLIFADQDGQAGGYIQDAKMFKTQDMLYTVQKGDTLWSIAVQHYPEFSQEDAIDKIQEKNGFQGTTIHAGQTILLP